MSLVRSMCMAALVVTVGIGACGKKDEPAVPVAPVAPTVAPTPETAPPVVEVDTFTAPAPEADTAEPALEADTAKAAEPEADTVAAAVAPPADPPAEPVVAPTDPTPEGDGADTEPLVTLKDSALTVEIVDRMPAERATTFSGVGTRIQLWVEVDSEVETVLKASWRKGDKVVQDFELAIGKSPHWRTWARRTIGKKDAGEWSVEVRDANDTLLATLPYTITAPAE